jgi:hypothetical protein
VPTTVFYLLSLYCFFRFVNSEKSHYLGLAGLFFVFSAFLRDANAVVYIAGYIPLLFIFRNRLNLRAFRAGSLSLALAFIPFVFTNKVTYGGLLSTGRSTAIAKQLEMGQPFIPFSIEDLSTVTYHHILSFLPVLALLGILGMIAAHKLSTPKERRTRVAFLVSILVVMATTIIVYGSRPNLFGFGTGWLFSSPTRYFLPIYIFLVVYTASLIQYLCARVNSFGKIIAVFIVLALAVSFFNLSFDNAGRSLPQSRNSVIRLSYQAATIDSLPQDSVIFTQKGDKIVFPSREAAIVFTEEALREHPFYPLRLPIVDIRSDVLPVIDELLDDGKSVYVTAEAEELITALRAERYEMVEIDGEWLYKLERDR